MEKFWHRRKFFAQNPVNNFHQMNDVVPINSSLWNAVRSDLMETFSRDIFRSWFEPLCVVSETESSITFGVVNDFTAIWLQENYLDMMLRHLRARAGREIKILFKAQDRAMPAQEGSKRANSRSVKENTKDCDQIFGPLNRQNTFDNFVVGAGNQMAHAACIAVANNPGRSYNPLFLYGDTGLGKTHLMQAVAHSVIGKLKRVKVVYMSTERFTNEFIAELQKNNLHEFRKKYRNVDVLLIDDIHFLSGKERIQEEFFHTFNELFESQKQIILSSDRPASEITKLESRLVSRFQWGLVADIQAPDLETRMAILDKKAAAMNIILPRDVIEKLANKVSRNVRKLEGALNRIANYVSITNVPINSELAEHILHDIFLEEQSVEATIDLIQKKVCFHFKLSHEDIVGKKRPANIAFPRQIAMYLCRLMTSKSLAEIGNGFGGRDHGTVIHACKTVENAMEQDVSVKKNVENLQRVVQQSL